MIVVIYLFFCLTENFGKCKGSNSRRQHTSTKNPTNEILIPHPVYVLKYIGM